MFQSTSGMLGDFFHLQHSPVDETQSTSRDLPCLVESVGICWNLLDLGMAMAMARCTVGMTRPAATKPEARLEVTPIEISEIDQKTRHLEVHGRSPEKMGDKSQRLYPYFLISSILSTVQVLAIPASATWSRVWRWIRRRRCARSCYLKETRRNPQKHCDLPTKN